MTDVIKSGNLFKFSDTVFNSKWKYNYVELLRNSTLRWFENKSERTPKRSVVLKDVCSFLAFGDIINQLPFKPEVKEDQINLVIAIPHDNNRNTRLSFFLCNNQAEMQEWVNSILSTVSDQNNAQQPPTQAATASYPSESNPTASYPGGQQNMSGSYDPRGPPNTAGYGPAGPYPGAQPHSMPPYQGAPPPYSGAPSGGPPPPIGFNLGGAPGGSYPPPPPQSYPAVSYPQPTQNYPTASYPQSQPPVNYRPPYQAGYNPQYPVQPRPYMAPAPQTYVTGNPPVQYTGQVTTQPAQTYVIVDGKKRKKKSKLKNAAIGLAAGAAGAYATHKLFHGYGHGWGHHHGYGGGWGHHNHWGGSWSSLSSFDSFGSWSD